MRRYLVGGAVRDELLGLPIKERDWVVVGSTPEQMLAAGHLEKDRQFQVYLDPELGEEHSLARTETVSGSGHRGFVISYAPDISLEADLRRRDLTINAIAKSESGELIDPYGGCEDLRKRLLRHVSSAFADDPLRLLRILRFSATLSPFNFSIAQSTMQILHKMTASATLDSLTENRKWKETQLALNSPGAKKFFDGLRLLGVEIHSLPQLETLTKLQPDVAEEFLDRASTIGARSTEQLAALACLSAQALDISTTTLISTYPYTLCSKQDQGWVKVVLTITTLVRQMSCQCTAEDYLRALEQTDSRRHESRFRSSASFVGELSKSSTYAFLDANILRNLTTAHETFMSVGIQDIPALTPAKEIGKALRAERLHAIEIALASGV